MCGGKLDVTLVFEDIDALVSAESESGDEQKVKAEELPDYLFYKKNSGGDDS